MSVLVGLNDREDFITKNACWCRGDGVLFWTFTGTIGLILLVSLVFKRHHRQEQRAGHVNLARILTQDFYENLGQVGM